jgi:hypothetical protein
LSAPLGVPQELYYRYSYRAWAALFRDVSKRLIKTAGMWPGIGWDALAPAGGLYRPFSVNDRMIKPFSMDGVPGIIFYFTFKGLTPQQVELIVALFWTRLKELLLKAKEAEEALAKALEELEALGKQFAEAMKVLFEVMLFFLCVVRPGTGVGGAHRRRLRPDFQRPRPRCGFSGHDD